MKPLASSHAVPTQHAGSLERVCVPGTEGETQSRSPERATPHQEVLWNQQVARSHVKAPQSSIRFFSNCGYDPSGFILAGQRTNDCSERSSFSEQLHHPSG